MIDPLTLSAAVTGATTAYNAIKKAIMVGKEIEDMSSELGRWMTAVSDVDNVHKNANNPTTFDKLFNRIKAGGKGGAPGQWSARKAQMLAKQYKAKGGGYK